MNLSRASTLLLIGILGCGDSSSGDGDGDGSTADSADKGSETGVQEAGTADGDGDGDAASGDGDGDGDSATGDGDGDTTSGDGDGDTTSGDGDGDTDGSICGDGMVEGNEECDDGNDVDDDACTNSCTVPPSPCGVQAFEAELAINPVDVIISIDNSGSMGQEIIGVQDNINVNFADILEQAGLDYRVILVSRHGAANGPESVCIEEPLSSIQAGGCDNPPGMPGQNPPTFYHYSTEISSHGMWCTLLDRYPANVMDEFGEPGWGQWLREDAVKTFIAISDDGVTCPGYDDNDNVNDGVNSAAAFDVALTNLDPVQFGTPEDRRYSFFSIVGMAYNNPATDPYLPEDPIILGQCPTAADNGSGHQALSILTGGLRFPLCDTASYDVVFEGIAQSVIESSPVSCEFPVPTPPDDEFVNEDSITIVYTPSGGGDPVELQQVPSAQDCAGNDFYIDNQTIYLCPAACELVQGDLEAQLDVEYLCVQPG